MQHLYQGIRISAGDTALSPVDSLAGAATTGEPAMSSSRCSGRRYGCSLQHNLGSQPNLPGSDDGKTHRPAAGAFGRVVAGALEAGPAEPAAGIVFIDFAWCVTLWP